MPTAHTQITSDLHPYPCVTSFCKLLVAMLYLIIGANIDCAKFCLIYNLFVVDTINGHSVNKFDHSKLEWSNLFSEKQGCLVSINETQVTGARDLGRGYINRDQTKVGWGWVIAVKLTQDLNFIFSRARPFSFCKGHFRWKSL